MNANLRMKNVARLLVLVGAIGSTIGATAYASTTEKTGRVKMMLMNPEGRVDGLLLEDGSQIHFPPHLSDKLSSVVAKSDNVKIVGEKESDQVFRADTVTNIKSGKSVEDTPPEDGPLAGPGAPPPPPRPGQGPMENPKNRQGLKELTASGKVETQLFGRRGEVNGVILADATIVRFPPRLIEGDKVKTTKGSQLKVTGFGTRNEAGSAIQATEINNN